MGVGHHLKEAILHYSDKEVSGVDSEEVDDIIDCLSSETEEVNDLVLAHQEAMDFIKKYNIGRNVACSHSYLHTTYGMV